jgi:hypothetical protein
MRETVNHGIEVGMLNAQLDQLAFGRMEIGGHRNSNTP